VADADGGVVAAGLTKTLGERLSGPDGKEGVKEPPLGLYGQTSVGEQLPPLPGRVPPVMLQVSIVVGVEGHVRRHTYDDAPAGGQETVDDMPDEGPVILDVLDHIEHEHVVETSLRSGDGELEGERRALEHGEWVVDVPAHNPRRPADGIPETRRHVPVARSDIEP
jgi:hypothetical protein